MFTENVLIRNLPRSTLAEIDKQAKIRGMSRNAFLVDFLEISFSSENPKNVFSEIEDIAYTLNILQKAVEKLVSKSKK